MNLSTCVKLFVASLLSLTPFGVSAIDGMHYKVEGQVSFSTGENTPFWLVSNREGLASIEKNNGYFRAGLFREVEKEKRFSWGAGVDLACAYNFSSSFIIQQLYGELKYRCLGLTIGSKEGIDREFNNRWLGSGNLLYSGNARPVPQIRVGIPDYTLVPLTKNWLSVKGYIAYGMFTDDNWQRHFAAPGAKRTERVLYHSKALFLKVENQDKFPAWFEGGLEMAAQFGGRCYSRDEVIYMPHGLKDILKVFFPSAGGSDTPIAEQTNILGNHVGSWDAKIGWRINKDWTVAAYYNHFFEDHSQMTFDYDWKDGLWGFEVTFPSNPVVSQFVYEYLCTKDQSSSVYWDHTAEIPEQVSGCDNYYNHGYYTGWQHWGMGIGNPILLSPIYNRDGSILFKTNRVKAHHFGFMGQPLPELGYRVLLTYSQNWGTYSAPYPEVKNNYNGLLEVTYQPRWVKGGAGILSFGGDAGALLGRSFGVMLTLRKTGWL